MQVIFQTHCHRCHGQEGSSEGGLNFVLNLEKLAKTYVKPKETAGSLLFERINAEAEKAMPPPGEEPRLSAENVALVKSWIEAGAPATNQAPRERITNEQLVKHIQSDLLKAGERSRRFLRYFTLTHLYNAGITEDELQTYRNAFAKLVNSLSWNANLATPTTIDPARTILRVDIRQLNWSGEVWGEIEAANPYFLRLGTHEALFCYEATQAKMPYVRVDWFVFAASRPPLYHQILGIPGADRELEQNLRVNVSANIEQEQVLRAGFNRSGVSQNNRLIEWHKSAYGSYWKSYDFGGNTGRQNLFEHPLGPDGPDSFRHDGGEIIFTLPNGLQGYMLVDGKGKRIDKGPTEIVSDPKQAGKTVTNGVSCMSCHYAGVVAKAGEIHGFLKANPNAFENAEDILALYREPKEMSAVFAEDAKRFSGSLAKLGVKNSSRRAEPISAMASRFEQELDLNTAASEFGVSAIELEQSMQGSASMARSFGALRTAGGTIKREVFVTLFGRAATEFRLTGDETTGTSSNFPSSQSMMRIKVDDENKIGEVRRFPEMGWGVRSLAFSPTGGRLAAGKMDAMLLLFDVDQEKRIFSLEKLESLGQITSCCFTPDGTKLVVSGHSGQVRIYDVAKDGRLSESGQFAGHSEEVLCLTTSSDGRTALSGGRERKVRHWALATGKELAVLGEFKSSVRACYIASNGKTGLATDGAELLYLDLAKGEVAKKITLIGSGASQTAAISPDGSLVAVGDPNNIRLWETQSGKELPKLVASDIQWSSAFTPDGARLVSGGMGIINVWDVRKQQRIRSIDMATHHAYVQCLAASPDNKHVAAIPGSAGQVLQVFRIPAAER